MNVNVNIIPIACAPCIFLKEYPFEFLLALAHNLDKKYLIFFITLIL